MLKILLFVVCVVKWFDFVSELCVVCWLFMGIVLVFFVFFFVVLFVVVFVEVLCKGVGFYFELLVDFDVWLVIKLMLIVVVIVVLLNFVFGVCVLWVIVKFEFCGKVLLMMLIDLLFLVLLVILGFVYVLLFGV